MDDLSFFTNDELIAELLRRKTFVGVVIHDKSNKEWTEDFVFTYNSDVVSREDVYNIVGSVTEHITISDGDVE